MESRDPKLLKELVFGALQFCSGQGLRTADYSRKEAQYSYEGKANLFDKIRNDASSAFSKTKHPFGIHSLLTFLADLTTFLVD